MSVFYNELYNMCNNVVTFYYYHGGGGGSSIVKVPGDVPPARVYFFELSSLAKGILFANFSQFSLGKGMLFGNLGHRNAKLR